MKLNELLSELSFAGRKCTKDCSGHAAGYAWAQQHPGAVANSHSPSFNSGAEVAAHQQQTGQIARPRIRDPRGKFAANPPQRKPKAVTAPTKPVAPQ